jgi:hypothetical protein
VYDSRVGISETDRTELARNKGVADEGEVVACSLRTCKRRQGTLVNKSKVVGEF